MLDFNSDSIKEIALTVVPIEDLLLSETKLPDHVMVAPAYWYIGEKENTLFAFSSNLYNRNIAEIKRIGGLEAMYRCDIIERFPPKEVEAPEKASQINLNREQRKKKNRAKNKRRLKKR